MNVAFVTFVCLELGVLYLYLRIQILEQRLARHEIQAIKKFTELEEALLTDPRLQAMWEKESSGFGDVDEDEEEELCGSSHAEGK